METRTESLEGLNKFYDILRKAICIVLTTTMVEAETPDKGRKRA